MRGKPLEKNSFFLNFKKQICKCYSECSAIDCDIPHGLVINFYVVFISCYVLLFEDVYFLLYANDLSLIIFGPSLHKNVSFHNLCKWFRE